MNIKCGYCKGTGKKEVMCKTCKGTGTFDRGGWDSFPPAYFCMDCKKLVRFSHSYTFNPHDLRVIFKLKKMTIKKYGLKPHIKHLKDKIKEHKKWMKENDF